jgi:antitoxin component of RelBE/YafQ-DinJ toxin-antitoxin module
MNADSLIAARVPIHTKERFATVARRHGVSESALLRRLIEAAILTAGEPVAAAVESPEGLLSEKVSVRLRPDDVRLLRERARLRQIRPSTYVALLVRSHLRNLSPLPTDELTALKRSIAEIGAIGRNLNHIARTLNRGEEGDHPDVVYIQSLLKALTGLRDHTKALVAANANSWETGHE